MTLKNQVITLFVITVISGISGIASAEIEKVAVDPEWIKETNKFVVYSIPGMDQIKEQKGLVYKQVKDTELNLNVYSPIKKTEKRPVIIFVHGGPVPGNLLTTPKDWGMFSSYGKLLAASGFVAVTFNYRLFDTNSYTNANNDINDLIKYVRKNADSLGIDKDRIFPWFFSGGGAFIAPMLRESPDYIRGIIGYYPVLDIKFFKEDLPVSMTEKTISQFLASFQMDRIKRSNIPLFLARAGLDNPELNVFIDGFVQTAISKNASLEFVNHSKGLHGFDNDMNDGKKDTIDIIKRTINFIKANGGQK